MTEKTESEAPGGSTQNAILGQAAVKRAELFELHKHYEAAAKDERDFFFRYLNFYIGLLSAILAVTLTGVLSLSRSSLNPPLKLSLLIGLLIGPILIIILSYVGLPILKVCQRRFIEAWVTTINIQAMLGLRGDITLDEGVRQPIYKGEYDNSFIAQFEAQHNSSLKILRQAAGSKCSSEKVLNELLEQASQVRMARAIFKAFRVAAIVLSVVITIAVLLSIQSPPEEPAQGISTANRIERPPGGSDQLLPSVSLGFTQEISHSTAS